MPKFHEGVLQEILEERVVSSRSRQSPRGVKRKMSNWPLRKRGERTNVPLKVEIIITAHSQTQEVEEPVMMER
jgi:hypothetical protein